MYCAKGLQTAIVRVSDWEDALRIGKSLRRWLFRGQEKAEWLLKSSLERVFEDRGIPITRTDPIEEMILMEFKSAAHLFSANTPGDTDTIAWLTLLATMADPLEYWISQNLFMSPLTSLLMARLRIVQFGPSIA